MKDFAKKYPRVCKLCSHNTKKDCLTHDLDNPIQGSPTCDTCKHYVHNRNCTYNIDYDLFLCSACVQYQVRENGYFTDLDKLL